MRGWLLIAAVVTLLASPPALAQTEAAEPDPRAEALNERGKSQFSDKHDYAAAAESFRRAIAISPDARYHYNLCAALEKLEKWEEALNACDAVFAKNPRPELAQKAGKKAADIRAAMRAAAEKPPATTGEPGTTPPPPTTTPPAPPASDGSTAVSAAAESDELGYRWGLGANLGLVINGSVGRREYARSGLAVQLHADGIVSERLRLGLQGYLHIAGFGQREDVTISRALSIVDLGAAIFWDRRLWRSLHLAPIGGLSLSVLSVDQRDGVHSYGTIGLRLEAAVEWRFPGGHHVLRFAPLALGWYLPAATQLIGPRTDAADFSLDRGGATWAITFGYCYRFERVPFPGWNLE